MWYFAQEEHAAAGIMISQPTPSCACPLLGTNGDALSDGHQYPSNPHSSRATGLSSTHLAPCSAFTGVRRRNFAQCNTGGVQFDNDQAQTAASHVLGQFLVRGSILCEEVVLVRGIALCMRPAARSFTSRSARDACAAQCEACERPGKACWHCPAADRAKRTCWDGESMHAV